MAGIGVEATMSKGESVSTLIASASMTGLTTGRVGIFGGA